jgi:hypothetical protein
VAPPSQHISGRRYSISVDHHPEDVPFAPLPHWLIEALGSKPSSKQRDWSEFATQRIGEGRRNVDLASLAGLLFRRLYQPELAAALVWSWNLTNCSPPLDHEEVAVIIDSIANREAERIRSRQDA